MGLAADNNSPCEKKAKSSDGGGENECGEDVAMIISPALMLFIKAE